jgi:hypothetical protein
MHPSASPRRTALPRLRFRAAAGPRPTSDESGEAHETQADNIRGSKARFKHPYSTWEFGMRELNAK